MNTTLLKPVPIAHTLSLSMPVDLPLFFLLLLLSLLLRPKLILRCQPFLEKLKQFLVASEIPQSQWIKVFLWVFESSPTSVLAVKWVTEKIIVPQLDWTAACDVFTTRYQTADYTLTLLREYDACEQGRDGVQLYGHHFTDLCVQLSISDDERLAASSLVVSPPPLLVNTCAW